MTFVRTKLEACLTAAGAGAGAPLPIELGRGRHAVHSRHHTPADMAQLASGQRQAQKLRTVVLTNTRQSTRFSSFIPDHAPDPRKEYAWLGEHGVEQVLRDRLNFPLNPFANKSVFWAGMDPFRGLSVLTRDREVDAVVCVFENTAVPIVALRRALRFKPPVFLIEISGRGWRPRDAVLDFVLPRVDQVLTLTSASRRYVESAYQLKRPAIVTGYWVDEAFFHPDAQLSDGHPRTGDYVLAIGDDHTRDFQLLIEACATLDIKVIIRTSLNVNIPDSMRERAEVIYSKVSYRELRDLYKQASVVALPLEGG